MQATVIKILGTTYTILLDGNTYTATPRGSIKSLSKILVGDQVDVSANEYGVGYVINSIFPRKSCLVRPPVANVDQLVIVMSIKPMVDYTLIDKLIIYCYQNNIKPVLVVNKCDIMDQEQILSVINQYKPCTDNIFVVSALNDIGIKEFKKVLRGKLSAFAGQSAVGKSTLLNQLIGKPVAQTNILSAKTERGKHTTRHTEIYIVDDDIMIADTAGFSMFGLDKLEPNDLKDYYPEFIGYKCGYAGCNHYNTTAKDCAIVAGVKSGDINELRFNRYIKLYEQTLEEWRRKYD